MPCRWVIKLELKYLELILCLYWMRGGSIKSMLVSQSLPCVATGKHVCPIVGDNPVTKRERSEKREIFGGGHQWLLHSLRRVQCLHLAPKQWCCNPNLSCAEKNFNSVCLVFRSNPSQLSLSLIIFPTFRWVVFYSQTVNPLTKPWIMTNPVLGRQSERENGISSHKVSVWQNSVWTRIFLTRGFHDAMHNKHYY